jgi:hypothetical protein
MPIDQFARRERANGHAKRVVWETPRPEPVETSDDVHGVFSGLKLPVPVASFDYPRHCRIRRVRVLAPSNDQMIETPGPVIVSKRALGEIRQSR